MLTYNKRWRQGSNAHANPLVSSVQIQKKKYVIYIIYIGIYYIPTDYIFYILQYCIVTIIIIT